MRKLKLINTIIATSIGAVGGLAAANPVQCNRTQTRCVAETTDLTIGDRVGFFNADGDLVATGQVKAMSGNKRAVVVEKRTGPIEKNDRVALLDKQGNIAGTNTASLSGDGTMAADSTEPSYKIYRAPAKLELGASLGYASMSTGDGMPAEEASVYAQWRKWGNLSLVGRATYISMSGNLNHLGDTATVSETLSVSGMGLLGGAAYDLFANQPLSLRVEAGLGGMQINSTLGGSSGASDANVANTKVKNGMDLYGRWSAGAVYNMTLWHLHLDFAESLINTAIANTLVAGVSRDLR